MSVHRPSEFRRKASAHFVGARADSGCGRGEIAGNRDWRKRRQTCSVVDMTFLQLFSRCLFRHGNMLRTRDEEGHLILQCADCGEVTRLLEQPVIKGPKHEVEPVKGAPIVKVKRGSKRQFTFPRSA